MKFFFLFFLLNFELLTLSSFAQNKNSSGEPSRTIDSLLALLKTDKHDTVKVNHLCQLIRESELTGNFDSGLNHGKDALELAFKLNYKKGIAKASNNIGNIYNSQGNYPEALRNYFSALKIFEEKSDKRSIAGSLANIGNVYKSQRNYSEALKNHFESLKIRQEIRDKQGIAASYNNIGNIYYLQTNYTKALEIYLAALNIKQEIGNKQGIATTLANIGLVFDYQKEYPNALNNYFAALKLYEEIGNKKGIVESFINIGLVNIKIGKLNVAQTYLSKALLLSKEIGSKINVQESYIGFIKLDSASGNYKSAFEHYKLFVLYRDSLFNEENIKKTVQAEMNFNFEKTQEAEKLVQEKKDALQHEEMLRQKTIRYSFTFGFALMLLLAIIILRSNKQKQRANIELANKNELIATQKQEVENQKEIVTKKNNEITDSINYAKRIQTSFLTSEKYISQRLSEYFILYNPRDIVSGDFYWVFEKNSDLYICTADCTGHGIPGAFMSLIAMGILNEIIYSKNNLIHTDEILNELRRIIILALNPEGVSEEGKDGMDLVLYRYNPQELKLEYSAANNSFYIIRTGSVMEFKPDKMPVGKYVGDEKSFTRTTIPLEKGDCIYTFSDGYADQFGGLGGKKFKSKQLKELLLANSHKPMTEQKKILNSTIDQWKGNLEQVDDITIIGIRI